MARCEEALQPYDPLRQVGEGIYCLDGEWQGDSFRRRMTVVRLGSGELVIHSAIRLREEDYRRLDELGRVRYVVVPNAFHLSEAKYYVERYPAARLLASPCADGKLYKQDVKVDGVLPGDWPVVLSGELECEAVAGLRLLGEVVLFHRPSRTLITTDLVFNLRVDQRIRGLERLLYRWNRLDRGFGPSRLFWLLFARDAGQVRESVRKMVTDWDIERVIMSHGEVLETGGRASLAAAFGLSS